jgi:hypothetical protein
VIFEKCLKLSGKTARKEKIMKNYICFNGKKIELTADQVAAMKKSLGIDDIKLSDISVGKTFKIGQYDFIVLEHIEEGTVVILKNLLFDDKEFGKNNNYENSYVDDLCNDFGAEIGEIIGEDNLIEHTVDLTSDDGLKDYGSIKRKMSLITCNQYRKYVEILDKHKIDAWWWLSTAYSTPTHENNNWIKCVSPSGSVNYHGYCNVIGVRPFCILKSNILVSKGE